MNKPTFILALDAGHYLATPGKRCLKSLDPKETREWLLNDRVTRYQQERARLYGVQGADFRQGKNFWIF